jgi:rare lipoprotein A
LSEWATYEWSSSVFRDSFQNGCMTQSKQHLWSGLTAALFLTTTLGTASVSFANPVSPSGNEGENTVSADASPDTVIARNSVDIEAASESHDEVVKVGEYQSEQPIGSSDEAIAEILPYAQDGRETAILYVNDIPVLTFLGSETSDVESHDSSSAQAPSATQALVTEEGDADVKVASSQEVDSGRRRSERSPDTEPEVDETDPVWRATAVAAKLNQLYRDGVDPASITVAWSDDSNAFVISANGEELARVDSTTILPDTTNNLAQDALQATNRIRRQMGGAAPLSFIEGYSDYQLYLQSQPIALGPVQFTLTGMASWYGPGFDGNYSASGEVFNQNALTAAHRSLPFGTNVRVTNLDNGLSVVVRVNDRGPYSGDRVIDLSMGAAAAIGLVQSGIAPVNLEVLGTTQTASN